jgi:hypothetical protein
MRIPELSTSFAAIYDTGETQENLLTFFSPYKRQKENPRRIKRRGFTEKQ